MLWDYTIILYWKSKEGYLNISTLILQSSILLSFPLQAVFIPKTMLETNWTTLFSFKNHMYIWICEFKKLATTDMLSIHLLLSTWNPIIVSLVTPEDRKTMAPTFISFCLCGGGGGGCVVGSVGGQLGRSDHWNPTNLRSDRYWLCYLLLCSCGQVLPLSFHFLICKMRLVYHNVMGENQMNENICTLKYVKNYSFPTCVS